jgi:hypothetical protein
MNREQMLKDGWSERKEYWTRKGQYGTWLWNKDKTKEKNL